MPRFQATISCYVRSILKHPDAQVVSIQINHKDRIACLCFPHRHLVAALHLEGLLLLLLN